jgi:hypothetical protein
LTKIKKDYYLFIFFNATSEKLQKALNSVFFAVLSQLVGREYVIMGYSGGM